MMEHLDVFRKVPNEGDRYRGFREMTPPTKMVCLAVIRGKHERRKEEGSEEEKIAEQ